MSHLVLITYNITRNVNPHVAGPLFFGGVACIGGMLLRTVIGTPVALEFARWLMFAGKFGVSAAFASIWIFAAELFPTR